MKWLHDNWLGIVLLMTMITFLFWSFAFFANGLFNCHFDLASCWSGMGEIVAAAAAGFGKWWVASKYNSEQGDEPK